MIVIAERLLFIIYFLNRTEETVKQQMKCKTCADAMLIYAQFI